MKQMPILYRQDAMIEKLGSHDTKLKNGSLSFAKKIRLLTYIMEVGKLEYEIGP